MTEATAPYNILNDNIIMSLFIMNIIGISYVFLMNGASILERIKCIFYYENKSTPFNDRTHITKVCNFILYAQTTFYSAIITGSYIRECGHLDAKGHETLFLGAYALFVAAFVLFKRIAFDMANYILFSKKEAEEWRDLFLFTIKVIGFALTPAVIAILFIPGIDFKYVGFYTFLTLLVHIYTITSSLIRIIFNKKRNYLDIFLYLCALEFLPLALGWKLVLQLNEFITTKI